MLQIEGLKKIYKGGKVAVDGLSLHVKPGDIYGFIGHNGAGKTTAIKCITGIHGFDEGRILIDGKSITEEPMACKRELAYLPDNPDLYEHLTGIQYLSFIADIFRIPMAERKRDMERYAEQFEIADSLGNAISSYSHGMKQKLAIISALIHHPRLLVMDEPFVGLDPKAAHTVKEMLREMCAAGAAVFFSTHVLEVAEKLCNKVAIIKNGRLVVAGSLEEVKGDASLEDIFLELTDHD